eukprot:580415-Prorocentrum_minimum.AAC.1
MVSIVNLLSNRLSHSHTVAVTSAHYARYARLRPHSSLPLDCPCEICLFVYRAGTHRKPWHGVELYQVGRVRAKRVPLRPCRPKAARPETNGVVSSTDRAKLDTGIFSLPFCNWCPLR